MFELPELPFAKDAMPDFCSAETFGYHHGKHHAGYVKKLNAAIEGTDFEGKLLENVILDSHKANNLGIFNNAAQHWNHSFFWNCLSPDGGGEPEGALAEKINASFRSFDAFREAFSDKAKTLFGSGWTWLVEKEDGALEIVQTSNADTPLTQNKKAFLTLDVWEHAYYIDHKNDRAKYVDAYWKYIHWDGSGSV